MMKTSGNTSDDDIFTTQTVRPESKGGQAGLTVFVDLEAEFDR